VTISRNCEIGIDFAQTQLEVQSGRDFNVFSSHHDTPRARLGGGEGGIIEFITFGGVPSMELWSLVAVD
jgi:hypothetical protein